MGKKAAAPQDGTAPESKPKAESPPKAKAKAEPKAKAEQPPQAKTKAAAAAPAAAPASTPAKAAAAKAPAEPKAKAGGAPKAAAPKAKAAAGEAGNAAAAKAQPKAAKAPAAAKGSAKAPAKAGGEPPAKASAKAQAKGEAAPAKAKSKAKAKAGAALPEPEKVQEPEKVDADDAEGAKKKKSRRAGRNKKATENDDAPEVQATHVEVMKAQSQARADGVAEKDADLHAMKARVAAAEASVAARQGGMRAEFEEITAEIDKLLAAKKAAAPAGKPGTSTLLEQSLRELEQSGDHNGMVKDVQKQIADARAMEVFVALRSKMNLLKGRCESALKVMSDAAKAEKAAGGGGGSKGGKGGKGGAGAAAAGGKGAAVADGPAIEEHRETYYLTRLASKKNTTVKDLPDAKLFQKTLELNPDVMGYLFMAPHTLKNHFEQEHGVVVDSVRAKGAGKGKPTGPPKELVVAGLAQQEVDACVAELKAMDVSGKQSKEVTGSMSSYSLTRELEKEFGVLVTKQRSLLTVFGPKAKVDAALAKVEAAQAEERTYSDDVAVDAEKAKALTVTVLNGLKTSVTATIRVVQPASESPKVRIICKKQDELEATKKKVEDFVKTITSEFVKVSADVMSKLYPNGQGKGAGKGGKASGMILKKFRGSDVRVIESDEGFQLIGPKAELTKLKVELKDSLKRAAYEPVKVTLLPKQRQIFANQDTLALICKNSGADVRLQRSGKGKGRGKGKEGEAEEEPCLVILGDESQVEAAKADIEQVIAREGSVEHIPVTEDASRALLAGQAAKIKELEMEHRVSLSLDKKTGLVTAVGPAKGVLAAKNYITRFAQQFNKEMSETVMKEMKVDAALIPRIIGTKGATLRNIRSTCGVKVTINDASSTLEIKGSEEDVAKAEQMISEILGTTTERAPVAKAKPEVAAAPRQKAAAFSGSADDFPALGGDVSSPKKVPVGHWGKAADEGEEDKADSDEVAPASRAVVAPAAAAVVAKEEEKEEEEEMEEPAEAAVEDEDDIFAMMGGMGEEIVYKVTAVEEAEVVEVPEVAAAPAAPQPDEEEEEEEEEENENEFKPKSYKFVADESEEEEEAEAENGGTAAAQADAEERQGQEDQPQEEVDEDPDRPLTWAERAKLSQSGKR
eukprot:CAMPEP_0170592094 /NCGR_PEP_ID=MMETSP0224-20130122/12748_1 /TAXON_ID=285029 /ORGANISM="Togula jolla, Strain CCCM 725" /LENGTH=1137 /DNA_ID=CAMNT_0010915991 /DNA_START=100 /DNA_END=3513 /DNA_ORIENTATION=+